MSFVNGQGRKILVNTVITVASVPNSFDFGLFGVSEFAGIAGMVKCDSNAAASLQLNYYQDSSGVTVISSAIAVGSGLPILERNPALYVNIKLTGVTSNTPARVYLTGLPIV